MSEWRICAIAAAVSLAFAQNERRPIIANPGEMKWEHEARDPAGAESVVLREDPKTGSLELFVRYPSGYRFPEHWHASNERILLIEGRLSLESGPVKAHLDPGGFAYLPAREVQRLSCVSESQCGFYIYWDGSPRSHKPPVK